MELLQKLGRARAIGISDYNATHIAETLAVATRPIALHQVEWNPLHHEETMLALCKHHGIQLQAWSPLGGARGDVLSNPKVQSIAAAHKVSAAQVVLKWSLQRGVAIVTGTANPRHMASDLDLWGFTLTDAEVTQIDGLQAAAAAAAEVHSAAPPHPRTPLKVPTHGPHSRTTKSQAAASPQTSLQPPPQTKEIAPGLFMPYINLGGVHSHPSNYSAWLQIGGVGLDTALMYGDDVQVAMGDAIRSSGVPRDKLFVTSKVPCEWSSAACVTAEGLNTPLWAALTPSDRRPLCPPPASSLPTGCPEGGLTSWCKWYDAEYADLDAGVRGDIDLRLLGLPQVDLMLLHWPCSTMADTIKTYRALEQFQLAGKAKAIGISNFNSSAIDALYAAGLRVEPAVNQCGFSIGGHNESAFGRDDATLARCKEKGITYSAYSPLGGLSHVDVLHDPRVLQVAAAHKKSAAQVALRWVIQQEVVAVTASTKITHLESDLQVFDFSLTTAEMELLAKI